MPDRLTSLDLTFLAAESAETPMHVGTVDVFEAPADGDGEGFDYENLVALIRDRIAFVPRYRQRVQHVPGRFAGPVWVDDEEFDITFHVRRSALPRPGTHEQLLELVSRIMSRRLDRGRPLWEMYLVEGLKGGRFAVVSKSHQALVDGTATVDIGQVVLDTTAHPRETPPDSWQPQRPPSALELLAGVFSDAVHLGARGAGRDGRLTGRAGGDAAPGEREPAARPDLRAAPVPHRGHAAGRLPDGAGDARWHRQ